jgi:hypothetical protein
VTVRIAATENERVEDAAPATVHVADRAGTTPSRRPVANPRPEHSTKMKAAWERRRRRQATPLDDLDVYVT